MTTLTKPTCTNDGHQAAEMIFNALDLSRYIFLCRECVAATHPRGYTQASTELFAKLGASEHQRVISVEVMGRSELRRSLLEAAQDLARS